MIRDRRKIFYPAGLISLVLFPALCIWHLNNQGLFKKIGAIDAAYFNHDENYEYSNSKSFKKIIASRNYLDIEFTGNKNDDKILLQFAKIKIKWLINSKDTVNGIHFKFTEKAKYWNFVEAIDICQIKNQYPIMDGNSIWISYHKPFIEETMPSFICGTQVNRIIRNMKARESAIFEQQLEKEVKYLAPSLILFSLMAISSFKKLKSA
jgi:hypothetical protein